MKESLLPNTAIGRYRILSRVGAGGMGEVYLAEDTKLNRKIALKILPAEFAADRERMRRFVQEAQAAAALNHPHIAHVYEIGEAYDTHFIAMEFVDGSTLRDQIQREKTDLKRMLRYLTQVADGLSKAHAVGVVHRDLKPENIMISRDGYAKILDFGLAKLVAPKEFQALSENSQDEADTAILQQHSQAGLILGTVGYMSPEQAQGKTHLIDNRSDIFSFGCILFESATGRRPFQGDSVVKTLHQIIYEPPPAIKEYNPAAPNDLQRIVRRCLAKDPDERYQTIKDVAIELRDLRREIVDGVELDATIPPDRADTSPGGGSDLAVSKTRDVVSTQPQAVATQPSGAQYIITGIKQYKAGLMVVLLALCGAAVAFGLYQYFGSNKVNSTAPFDKAKITKLTKTGGVILTAISPDGKYFAHVASNAGQQALFVRQTSANNDIPVIPAAPVEYWGITFSKDSNDLYYAVREPKPPGVLYRIPALGGTPQRLMDRLDSPVTFSPDGKKLAFVRSDFPNKGDSALITANSDGTDERVLASRKLPERFAPLYFTGPSWSSDGKTIAVTTAGSDLGLSFKMTGVNVSDGSERDLTRQKWGYIGRIEWLEDGKGLILIGREQTASFRQVWYLSLADGAARQLTNDFNDYRSLSLTADSTKLVTAQLDRLAGAWVAPMSDINQARQIIQPDSEGPIGMSWAPNGRMVYFLDILGNTNLWVVESDGSGRKQLTNVGSNSSPQISPDGSSVVFLSNRSGAARLWLMGIDGSNPKQITDRVGDSDPTFSADGRWIIYASYYPETLGLWKIPVEGGSPIRLTEGKYQLPAVSPDGKLIAAMYLENTTTPDQRPDKIAVVPIDGGKPIASFGLENNPTAGSLVIWSIDGKNLIYNRVRDNIANLWSQPLAGGEPKQISDFKDSFIFSFALSRDGKQIVISRGNYTRDAILLSDDK